MKRKKAADFATPLSDRFVNLGDDTTEEGLEFFEVKNYVTNCTLKLKLIICNN